MDITNLLSVEGIYDLLLHSYFDPDCYKKARTINAGILTFNARVTINGDPVGVGLTTVCIGRMYDASDAHRGDDGFRTEYVRIELFRMDDHVVYDGIVKAHYRMQRDAPDQDYYPYFDKWELYRDVDYDTLDSDEELNKSGVEWKPMPKVLYAAECSKHSLLKFKEDVVNIPEFEINTSDFVEISRKLDEIQFRAMEKFLALTNRKPLTLE